MSGGRAFVTGGAGFLGHHLIAALLDAGWYVDTIDNFWNGRRQHLQPFHENSRFRLSEGDLRDAAFVSSTVRQFAPEVVFHLAALHFIPYCQANPAATIAVNVLGTQHLLDALEGSPVETMILASTADVYAPSERPHREAESMRPSNIYGLSKSACEELLRVAQHRMPRVRFFAARLFNLIGPGETNPHIIPAILENLNGGDVQKLGNLTPRRDYVFVKDAAAALMRMAAYEGAFRTFNVGTGVGNSVVDVVQAIERIVGRPLRIEVDPAKVRPIEREHLIADSTLARMELGWAPTVAFDDALREAVVGGGIS